MRASRTLARFLVREVAAYTLLGLVAIALVLVTRNLLRFLDELIAVGFSLPDLLAVLRCLASTLAVYALPVAFLFGVLLAIGRMAADAEILALRACGFGLRDILLPVCALGILVSGGTWWLALDVEHRAHRELRAIAKSMAVRGTMIEPGQFQRIGPRVVYVRGREGVERLQGVLISDRSDIERPLLIFAEYGSLDLDEERGELHFRLENGDIHVEPADGEELYQRISFRSFDYAFDVESLLGRHFSGLRPREMTMPEMRAIVARARSGDPLDDVRKKNPAEYELEIHRRLALPLAPFLFGLIGVPLALRRKRGARSWGAFLCALVAFSFYAILTFSQFLALEHWIPAALALWLPNLAVGSAATALLWRARRPEA